MNNEENIRTLAAIFRARFPAERVRDLASEGHPILGGIDRHEDWAGMGLHFPDAGVTIQRTKDYERVRFAPDEKAMMRACVRAIRALGQRIEAALSGDGTPMSKDFAGKLVPSEMTPTRRWEKGAALYSCGAVPMVLGDDGLVFYRVAKLGHDGSDDTPIQYSDELEARFGFYGNTGPLS